MDTDLVLRRAIRRRPDDWPTWLVFADHLTDIGDPRGRLILLHHHLASTRGGEAREAIQAEIEAIEHQHRAAWAAKLRPGRYTLDWRHGFVIGVALSALDGEAVARIDAHPSALLHSVGICVGLDADQVAAVVAWPTVRSLAQLDLYHCYLGDDSAAVLARAPALGNLVELRLVENQIGAEGVLAIATSPHLVNLELLDLSDNHPLDDADVRALTVPGRLPSLRVLRLNGRRLAPDTVAAIVAAHPGCSVTASFSGVAYRR